MRPKERLAARRQLDKRLNLLQDTESLAPPPRGWIRAIRDALGMTTAQLGKRVSVSQPRIIEMEKAEAKGTITLDSLERAARALNCRLVYAFVPNKPLEEIVAERARLHAEKRLAATRHSMALEAQDVEPGDEHEQLQRLIRQLVEQPGSSLWEDPT